MKQFRISRQGKRLLALFAGSALFAAVTHAEVSASGGWSRATVPGAKTAVGYLVLTNSGNAPRKLLKIASPVSDTVSVHQSSVDAQGMARMWPVATLLLRPGESRRFEPGGLHLMFDNLKGPFMVGQSVPLHLTFDGNEAQLVVQLQVRPLVPEATPAPGAQQHAHH
jgi:copper(I)-binding protein